MAGMSAQIALKQLQFKGHWFRAEKWYTRAKQLICFILPCVGVLFFLLLFLFFLLASKFMHVQCAPVLIRWIYNFPFNSTKFRFCCFSFDFLSALCHGWHSGIGSNAKHIHNTFTIEKKKWKNNYQAVQRSHKNPQWQYTYNITENGNTDNG